MYVETSNRRALLTTLVVMPVAIVTLLALLFIRASMPAGESDLPGEYVSFDAGFKCTLLLRPDHTWLQTIDYSNGRTETLRGSWRIRRDHPGVRMELSGFKHPSWNLTEPRGLWTVETKKGLFSGPKLTLPGELAFRRKGPLPPTTGEDAAKTEATG